MTDETPAYVVRWLGDKEAHAAYPAPERPDDPPAPLAEHQVTGSRLRIRGDDWGQAWCDLLDAVGAGPLDASVSVGGVTWDVTFGPAFRLPVAKG